MFEWYQVDWFDEYGKRHSTTAKTLNEAYEILSVENKRSMKNSRKDLKTFVQAMREWYQAFRVDNACEERNKTNIREIDRIPRNIADKPLPTVTAQELQAHLNSIKNDSPRITAKTMLCSFLRYMFTQGFIKKDIGVLLKAPHPQAAEKQVLLVKDEQKFLAALPEKFRKYAVGLIYTGCRYSEFISIQAEDVDRENKLITIRETKSVRANERRRGLMYKTRQIPLLPIIETYEFPLPYISQAYFQKAFQKASAELGIKVTPHDMRHTFATRCDDFGIKEKVIQGILGHKNERMTRHYKNHKTAELLESEYTKLRENILIDTPIIDETIKAEQNQVNQILSIEDESNFITLFPENFRSHLIGMIYTGCTFGELTRIQEEDIDRTNRTIFIKETKMGSEANKSRVIPLLNPIKELKFPLPDISKKYFFTCFRAASQKLDINITVDGLPHTFTARCVDYAKNNEKYSD